MAKDTAFRLYVNTDGWSTATRDSFEDDLLRLAARYGTPCHVEIPLLAWAEPAIQWAQSELERCRAVKDKPYHHTVSNARRSAQGSSWRCGLVMGHEGMHMAPPSAKQSPWQ